MCACRYTTQSKKEQKALEELKHKENIAKTNAEKGGTVVILDVKDHTKESARELNKAKNYR